CDPQCPRDRVPLQKTSTIFPKIMKRRKFESQVGDVLREIIDSNKLRPGMDEVAVRDAWKSMMGNGVNSYTRNVALKGTTLYVELTSAVLREELQYGKDKIVRLIND